MDTGLSCTGGKEIYIVASSVTLEENFLSHYPLQFSAKPMFTPIHFLLFFFFFFLFTMDTKYKMVSLFKKARTKEQMRYTETDKKERKMSEMRGKSEINVPACRCISLGWHLMLCCLQHKL